MTVKELMDRLSKFDPEAQVMVLDSFNGGGSPREINLGPVDHVLTETDSDATCDCEGMVGQTVVLMGFGCY